MLKIKKIDANAVVPTCGNPGEDLGYDLYALENTTLLPGEMTRVRTGISAQFDPSPALTRFGLLLRDRSSVASNGMLVFAGVIDSGYTGEIQVVFLNTNRDAREFKAGQKIAQMLPIPVFTGWGKTEEVESFITSERQEKGFGSSGDFAVAA